MIWWFKYMLWNEYHRHCDVVYNSFTGYLICRTDKKEFLYDDCPAARGN